MTFEDLADKLVDGCRTGKTLENLDLLYAPDAISIEAMDNGTGRQVQGLDAIRAKHVWWDTTFETMGGDVSDPLPSGDDRFAVIFEIKVRHKESGEVSDMKEVALYTVAQGKIAREEFFYGA